jgi:hypothetical protein
VVERVGLGRQLAAYGGSAMHIDSNLIAPIVALVAGILILVQPQLLNLIVAIYLIVVGVMGLAPHFMR